MKITHTKLPASDSTAADSTALFLQSDKCTVHCLPSARWKFPKSDCPRLASSVAEDVCDRWNRLAGLRSATIAQHFHLKIRIEIRHANARILRPIMENHKNSVLESLASWAPIVFLGQLLNDVGVFYVHVSITRAGVKGCLCPRQVNLPKLSILQGIHMVVFSIASRYTGASRKVGCVTGIWADTKTEKNKLREVKRKDYSLGSAKVYGGGIEIPAFNLRQSTDEKFTLSVVNFQPSAKLSIKVFVFSFVVSLISVFKPKNSNVVSGNWMFLEIIWKRVSC